ncbi:hypothetical protein LAZ67_11000993 [Cordylochernes scorpioides]|uniref:Transposase n=1 Tax=Cordylochernes scorpioides TaxID=51811 RepID=A0ABY6KY64_9ARAC|nr:hypothetical protein LAZ67_11000993 [Cordylochernes scorpioides]
MPQPPYSPDLAPCDFFLFPKLKRPMKGRRYATLDEIKTASKEELKKILKNDFLKCFEDWKNRWHNCIISHGDYFEGDKIVLQCHHDNARSHTSAQTFDFLANSGVQLVTHPPYSPDLAPCDFFISKNLRFWNGRFRGKLDIVMRDVKEKVEL